jgi:hypothetical protein
MKVAKGWGCGVVGVVGWVEGEGTTGRRGDWANHDFWSLDTWWVLTMIRPAGGGVKLRWGGEG